MGASPIPRRVSITNWLGRKTSGCSGRRRKRRSRGVSAVTDSIVAGNGRTHDSSPGRKMPLTAVMASAPLPRRAPDSQLPRDRSPSCTPPCSARSRRTRNDRDGRTRRPPCRRSGAGTDRPCPPGSSRRFRRAQRRIAGSCPSGAPGTRRRDRCRVDPRRLSTCRWDRRACRSRRRRSVRRSPATTKRRNAPGGRRRAGPGRRECAAGSGSGPSPRPSGARGGRT